MIDVEKLREELSSLPEGWVILLETTAENALEVSIAAIKILSDRGYNGIILSASRPYSNLIDLYKKNGIETEKMFFLDCISNTEGLIKEESSKVLYLEGLSALTNISISMNNAIEALEDNRFIFIDSITTMLIYNEANIFARFIHSILTKIRVNGISGLLVSLENETNREVRSEIAQLCDKIIKV